eukprot:scaffold32339_cov61-Phaeocystis_antarctica.AAC.4
MLNCAFSTVYCSSPCTTPSAAAYSAFSASGSALHHCPSSLSLSALRRLGEANVGRPSWAGAPLGLHGRTYRWKEGTVSTTDTDAENCGPIVH